MGKPFATELSRLSQTLRVVASLDRSPIEHQLQAATSGPVSLIGTGGSFTSAQFGRLCFDRQGVISQATTSLELVDNRSWLRGGSVFLLSASGNNKDVLAAFEVCREREADRIVGICASRRSKLSQLVSKCEKASIYEFSLPTGRDGYLATNSLVATCSLLSLAFENKSLVPEDAPTFLEKGREHYAKAFGDSRLPHCVILFSGWGQPAAVDLESKLSEAGIAPSMLADFRQFAHGRHNWFDKQKGKTSVICFSTPEDENLAKATLSKLPATIPVCHFHTSVLGAVGSLELLVKSFGFVTAAGVAAKIDPGRPGVPAYGSKLYHLGPKKHVRRVQGWDLRAAVTRKVLGLMPEYPPKALLQKRAEAFLSRLYSSQFGALVADFDGTILPAKLRNGPIPEAVSEALIRLLKADISIYFATGRGDSIHKVLLETFPRRFRHLVFISYFNGAFCLPLSEANAFPSCDERIKELDAFGAYLEKRTDFTDSLEIKNKGWQITIKPSPEVSVAYVVSTVQELLAAFGSQGIRMVVSSHSIDVIPTNSSKASCIQASKQGLPDGLQVLTMGDRGAFPGNDFELLQHPFSLSVDTVSTGLDSCWNLLPAGISNTEGAAFYLSRARSQKGFFTFQS